ncbi:MAG: hypothetical protein ACETVR_03345 [Candidatus Bathyarchaeia archaeon]
MEYCFREVVAGPAELLREAIRRCLGSDGCGLCQLVLDRLEAAYVSSGIVNRPRGKGRE